MHQPDVTITVSKLHLDALIDSVLDSLASGVLAASLDAAIDPFIANTAEGVMSMLTHTIQRHHPSGEIYVLRYKGSTITGLCGPLHHSEYSDDGGLTVKRDFDRSNCDFSHEDVDWANDETWSPPMESHPGHTLTNTDVKRSP